jgi:hypothetical protein
LEIGRFLAFQPGDAVLRINIRALPDSAVGTWKSPFRSTISGTGSMHKKVPLSGRQSMREDWYENIHLKIIPPTFRALPFCKVHYSTVN